MFKAGYRYYSWFERCLWPTQVLLEKSTLAVARPLTIRVLGHLIVEILQFLLSQTPWFDNHILLISTAFVGIGQQSSLAMLMCRCFFKGKLLPLTNVASNIWTLLISLLLALGFLLLAGSGSNALGAEGVALLFSCGIWELFLLLSFSFVKFQPLQCPNVWNYNSISGGIR